MKRRKISGLLIDWYGRSHRDLPWRRTSDPYRVWVSEIMLQQTRAQAVVPYFERFLERFPTVEALAGAEEEEALALWSGLGYYSRARNLLRAAVAEMLGYPNTPAAIVINESLEIARRYAAPESVQFLNGVLDAIARTLLKLRLA